MATRQHPFPAERNVHRPLRRQKLFVFLVLQENNSTRPHAPLPVLHDCLIQQWTVSSMSKRHVTKPLLALSQLIRKLMMLARTDLHLAQLNIPLNINKLPQLLMKTLFGLDLLPIDPHSPSVILHKEQKIYNSTLVHKRIQQTQEPVFILLIMEEAYLRRLQGNSTIKRSDEYQHINTTILPRERTIQAVGYYNRRKKELRKDPSQEIIINLTNRNAERHDLKNHIETLFKSSKSIDPYISNYIKQIRGEPVFSDNKFTNFNQEQYPLKEDEKVKIVEQRYFPLQNYYNYIYDLEIKKDIFRVVEQERQKESKVEVQKSVCASEVENYERSQLGIDQIVGEKQVKDKKIRGFYESRFDSKARVERQPITSIVKELIPHQQHSIYQPQQQKSLIFTVNENTRERLSTKQ